MTQYTVISTVNNEIEFEITGLTYEQASAKAETLTRQYGYSIAHNAPMRKDGVISMFGEENTIKIVSQNGLAPVAEIFIQVKHS